MPPITKQNGMAVTSKSNSAVDLAENIYNRYLDLLRAIYENDLVGIDRIGKETLSAKIFNNYDPRWDRPLFYAFKKYREKCPSRLIELLLEHGASLAIRDHKFDETPYQIAQQQCENWLEIKSIFDRFMPTSTNITTEISLLNTMVDLNTTELVVYKQKKPVSLKDIFPLSLFYFFTGVLSASLDRFADTKKEKYPLLPFGMTYGLKPTLFSLGNSIFDSLVLGSASTIHVEAQWSSFFTYLAMNYVGLVIAQPISRKISAIVDQKIISKYWNLTVKFAFQTLTLMFFFNPGLFVSETFMQRVSFMVILQILNGMLFSAGELGLHALINYLSDSKNISETPKGSSTIERNNASQTEAISLISVTNSVMNSEVNAEALALLPSSLNTPITEEGGDALASFEERFISSKVSSALYTIDSGRGSSSAGTVIVIANSSEQEIFLFRLRTIKASLEVLQDKLQKFPKNIRHFAAFPRMFEEPLRKILDEVNAAKSSDNFSAFETSLASFIAEKSENNTSLKAIEWYLELLEPKGDMGFKTHINVFRAELIIQINYLNFLAQNWLEILSPDFFVITGNEIPKADYRILLTRKVMNLVRGYFCKLERLNSYELPAFNLNSIYTALQILKSIFFHADLETITDKPFPNGRSQLIEQCARCATNFDLAAKQLFVLQSEIVKIVNMDLRTNFYKITDAFKKICEQENYFFTNRIDSIKAEEKGIKTGEKKTLEFIKKGGVVKCGDFSSVANETILPSDKGASKLKPPLLSRKPKVVHNTQGFFATSNLSENGVADEGYSASTSFQEESASTSKFFRI